MTHLAVSRAIPLAVFALDDQSGQPGAGGFHDEPGRLKVTYSVTPLMFANALVQYSFTSGIVSANIRFRWEYRPGSELFVVHNEERDARVTAFPDPSTRALIIKLNRLFRF